jgi:hypothetical protein
MTPTLSDEGDQATVTLVAVDAEIARFPGAVGGVASAGGELVGHEPVVANVVASADRLPAASEALTPMR